MSDILVTMDDGSQTLVHYGVMGMKWGKRNAETLRKYRNSGGDEVAKFPEGMKWGTSNPTKSTAKTSKKNGKVAKVKKTASKAIDKAEKTAERFVNDEKYRNKAIKKGVSKTAGTLGGVAAGSAVKAVGVAAVANPVTALAIGSVAVAGTAAAGYAAWKKLKKE